MINDPPYFKPNLTNQSAYAGSTIFYKLPTLYDPEGGPVNLTLNLSSLPSFLLWMPADKVFIIAPNSDEKSVTNISINLSDGAQNISYIWQIKVLPPPKLPKWLDSKILALRNLGPPIITNNDGNLVSDIRIYADSSLVFELPNI